MCFSIRRTFVVTTMYLMDNIHRKTDFAFNLTFQIQIKWQNSIRGIFCLQIFCIFFKSIAICSYTNTWCFIHFHTIEEFLLCTCHKNQFGLCSSKTLSNLIRWISKTDWFSRSCQIVALTRCTIVPTSTSIFKHS